MRDDIEHFKVLFEKGNTSANLLTPALTEIYGNLGFNSDAKSLTIVNFVVSLDGRTSYKLPSHKGGADISNKNPNDRLLMSILRAISDIVVVGAGTLRDLPHEKWAYDNLVSSYLEDLRILKGSRRHRVAIVSQSGVLPKSAAVLEDAGERYDLYILTTPQGAKVFNHDHPNSRASVVELGEDVVDLNRAFEFMTSELGCRLILSEGGPSLFGQLLKARLVNEIFITISPKIIGDKNTYMRPSLVEGVEFNPDNSPQFFIKSLRKAGEFLFLRYGLI